MKVVRQTILIIEDDVLTLKLLDHILKKAGYCILTAKNGDEGIEIMDVTKPDLIITDIVMPKKSGWEVVKKASKGGIPVIVLSAFENEEHVVRAFELGAEDFVNKPFLSKELLIRVKKALFKKLG